MDRTGRAVIAIEMPQVGNTMEEGTILSWRVGVGDRVEAGQVIFEVETDKAAVEVEAVAAGRLARIVVAEGEVAPILTPVAYLGESDADVDQYLAMQGVTAAGRRGISPAARRLAGELKVDVEGLPTGSGPKGRVLSGDVMKAAKNGVKKGGKRTPLSKLRRAIALGLQRSKQTIPHFYMERDVDAGPMLSLVKAMKGERKSIGINDLIVYACGRTLTEFPAFRSRLEGDEMVEVEGANVGVAVQTEAGLMVPVVTGIEEMTLGECAVETRRVIKAAKGGKLYGDGSAVFTVSNMGMFGVERFSAIINPPEAAILAVGAAREEAVAVEGKVGIGVRMSVTLSCDHRIIDGVVAAKFLNRLKELLEDPAGLAES